MHDRAGNRIYLTEVRWQHIVEANSHAEMAVLEDRLKEAIKTGRRRQEPFDPRKYRYVHLFDDLPLGFNHIVGIVIFGFDANVHGETVPWSLRPACGTEWLDSS